MIFKKLVFCMVFMVWMLQSSCLSSADKKKEPVRQPNIILIMADDMGWGDTGYNGNTIIKTPFLDQMADEGIRFDRFYSASAVCSPTRASVLTGRNPYRMGIFTANCGILRTEEVTLPELLKAKGYTTGHFGKWHLGTLTKDEKDANRAGPGNTKEYNPPALHGYDVAFVTESKVPTYDPMKKPVTGFKREGWDYLKEHEDHVPYGTYYWDIEGNKVTENLEGDDSRVIMDRVVPFVSEAVNKKQAFLAVVWFHTPHMPCVAGPRHQAMYKEYDGLTRNYAGCITAMDEQIGRLQEQLKKLGADANTMIWFCSDNGPENGNPGSSGGFKEQKRSLHEGGIRVPGLLVWPEKIKEAFSTDIPCVTSDYLPTIAEIVGVDRKDMPYNSDGISLKGLIDGQMKQRNAAIGFCFGNQAVYMNDENKLYLNRKQALLYNMKTDSKEKSPLSNQETSEQLQKELEEFVSSCHSSFNGDEYGTQSVDKLQQKWECPLAKQ